MATFSNILLFYEIKVLAEQVLYADSSLFQLFDGCMCNCLDVYCYKHPIKVRAHFCMQNRLSSLQLPSSLRLPCRFLALVAFILV
jgi:hypothetical protein